MQESWKKINGYPYEISDMGRLRHIKHKRLRKFRINTGGYYQTTIGAKKTTVIIHRLVAEYFLGGGEGNFVVDHINRNRLDNRAVNLQITTYKENSSNKITRVGVYKHILELLDEGISRDDLRKHLSSMVN